MLGPKAGGALGLFIGLGVAAVPWFTAEGGGKVSVIAGVMGPAVAVMSVAMLVLPTRSLFVPDRVDEAGVEHFDFQKPKYTPLMYVVMVAGGLVGVGYLYFLVRGF